MVRVLRPNVPSRADSFANSYDDFMVVDESQHTDLALRFRYSNSSTTSSTPPLETPASCDSSDLETPRLQINSIESKSSFLVSFHPPATPPIPVDHVPCDIVLVIDVSGSMADLAPLPDVDDEQERAAAGLTVLDLVRHLCRAIISTLNKKDRLALVTFSQDATVHMDLRPMNTHNKETILDIIENLKDDGATNLWAGIKTGLKQFEDNPPIGNVQTMFVLTDGMPNYMCPLPGYIPKLQPLLDNLAKEHESRPTINTFGFGYSIRSDLMLSIAKAGNGNFSFISDVGMIGTIFVHAVANLYSTYATNAILELTFNTHSTDDIKHTSGLPFTALPSNRVAIQLGNIQYGQSRDLIVKCRPDRFRSNATIQARLSCERGTQRMDPVDLTHALHRPPTLPRTVLDYHFWRNQLCTFFSSLFPVDGNILQHKYLRKDDVNDRDEDETDADGNSMSFHHLTNQILEIPEARTDLDLRSLLIDLLGPGLKLPKGSSNANCGQIYQALDTMPLPIGPKNPYGGFKVNWEKWGHHYLASLWCAHMRQTCNSFKDAGPLRYGSDSEIFTKCKARLDSKFDGLAPPKGTWRGLGRQRVPNSSKNGGRHSPPISMKRYNCVDNSCVLGGCKVLLADKSHIKVEDLRPGMKIWNPVLQMEREVKEIVKGVNVTGGEISRVGNSEDCKSGSLWITSWHPIRIFDRRGEAFWTFPKEVAQESRALEDDESVYSILLESDNDVDAHAMTVENVTCVTLGHGLATLPTRSDPRAHPFFGNHRILTKSIKALTLDQNGHRLCGGLIRNAETGLACGVIGASPDESIELDGNNVLRGEHDALKARI